MACRMKVVANLEGRQPKLAEQLRSKGIRTKVIDRSTLVDLPPLVDRQGCRVFRLPQEVSGALLFLDCSEFAGEIDGKKLAMVVCGLSGKPLRPYFESRGKGKKYKRFAHFSSPQTIVTVQSQYGNISIMKHQVELVQPGTAKIVRSYLWSGKAEAMPDDMERFLPAVQSAQAKFRSPDPHRLHFAAK